MSEKNNAAVCTADAGSSDVQPETLGDLLGLLLDEASRLESLCWAVQPENRPPGMATAANDLRATIQQARAGLHALAAAPDLLKALEACAEELNEWQHVQEMAATAAALEMARAAIAKAKGAH